jgi:hypothetical protein
MYDRKTSIRAKHGYGSDEAEAMTGKRRRI